MPKAIQLGNEIVDVVSKVRGIAHGRVEYLDGTRHWIIQPEAVEGVKQPEVYAPVEYCEYVSAGVLVAPPKKVMGFHAAERQAS
jgi:hypothetical protein